ncbi:SulP family inorganic anion transporter [Nocardiopsis baichengensis]|uniref:SulP family inorganic anion transporter n=1 Tax=Nocardiopsis baichengensis TaxID=280240 RepID=UPI00034B5180|nr:SulP family inorganic anion transporter [Nocardiopsis baichengensis]
MRHDAPGAHAGHPGHQGLAARLRSLPLLSNPVGDVSASLVVFLVAVPLSLGIAAASGAPLMAGIIAAAVGGIVAGLLGGSRIQVTGPSAAQTVIIADLVMRYGWEVMCLITLLAGVLQALLGAVRIARAALAVSPAVIHGMLAGVGVTIALAQVHVVLGGDPPSSAVDAIRALPGRLADAHPPAVAVGALTIALLLLWPRLPGLRRLRAVPAALVAVTAATAAAVAAGLDVERVSLLASMGGGWTGPVLPDRPDVHGVAIGVVTVCLVASVESLLSGLATDRLHDGPRIRLDRELVGQGAANAASGALGGLPVSGAIVRSTANARAGARTPAAAALHGVWVVVFVLLFAPLVELIPMAALAGLLVMIGAQMVDPRHLSDLRRHHEASVYLVTLAAVVLLGLLEGVIIGFALALAVSLRRLTRLTVLTEERDGRWHVVVQGSLTFLGVPRVARMLRTLPTGCHVDLDLHVDFMDHAAFESIHAWRVDHERTGGSVDIDEVHENWYERSTRHAPPVGKTAPGGLARWWAPWRMRGGYDSSAPATGLLVAGAQEYHSSTAGRMRAMMGRLAHRQHPTALFITCADSRVVPNLITASGPGDLFTVRNLGNLVPAHDQRGDASVGAAVEYAVEVLEVPSIVVCGHSHCGAMKALMDGVHTAPAAVRTERLRQWLGNGRAALERTPPQALESAPGAEALRALAQANVEQQLENLLTYPAVRRRHEQGLLELTGLFYDLDAAEVRVLDPAQGEFVPVADRTGGRIPGPRGPIGAVGGPDDPTGGRGTSAGQGPGEPQEPHPEREHA